MRRRAIFVAALWLAIAAAATAAGVAAIDVLGDGITGSEVRPLDGEAIRRALSHATASTTAWPDPSTPPPSGAVTRNLDAGGGTVTARCAGERVTLLAWTPAQGFRAEEVSRGPATVASLKLTSDSDEYEVTVTCASGVPVAHPVKDDGHRRGGGGDDHD
jgi:hypothetical protein